MQHNQQPINPAYHQRRARLHLWQDGIFEILIGIAAVLFSVFSALLPTTGESTPARIIVEVVMMAALFFIGWLAFSRVGEMAKARVTYPRSGFVRLSQSRPRISPMMLVLCVVLCVPLSAGLGVGLAVALMYTMAALGLNIALFLLSGLLALPAVILARRNHQRRLYGLAAGILIIGAGLSAFGPLGECGITLLFLFTGLLTAFSGCVALWGYLQRHPAQEETAHGRF